MDFVSFFPSAVYVWAASLGPTEPADPKDVAFTQDLDVDGVAHTKFGAKDQFGPAFEVTVPTAALGAMITEIVEAQAEYDATGKGDAATFEEVATSADDYRSGWQEPVSETSEGAGDGIEQGAHVIMPNGREVVIRYSTFAALAAAWKQWGKVPATTPDLPPLPA